jgi:hypothetical protein
MSKKVIDQLREDQEAGDKKKAKRKHVAKDFDAECEGAKHYSHEGWVGIPASAFKQAMIDACRTAGVTMTVAKAAIIGVAPDGFDRDMGDPLVKITSKAKPQRVDSPVRLPNGSVDIRPRPHWPVGWTCVVRIRFDADMIAADDVANLLTRAGIQIGIGEGRPYSKKSVGMGWGTFSVEGTG